MDLRIIKTKHQICQAYLALRNQYAPEKIKVKDICERAKINKTTFYKHYVDALDLANEIEESCMEKLLCAFAEKKSLFESPKAYVQGLLGAVEKQAEELRTVYSDRMESFVAKLESRLIQYCIGNDHSAERRMAATFMISGMVSVLAKWLLCDEGKLLDITAVANCMERLTGSLLSVTK